MSGTTFEEMLGQGSSQEEVDARRRAAHPDAEMPAYNYVVMQMHPDGQGHPVQWIFAENHAAAEKLQTEPGQLWTKCG